MKKTITLMLCIILCFSILSGCAQTSDNIEDITKEYIVKISENDYNSASKYFSDEYREKTSEEKEIDLFNTLVADCGSFLKVSSTQVTDGNENNEKIVSAICAFENANATYEITFNSENKIIKIETKYTIFSDTPQIPYNVNEIEMTVGAGTEWALDGTFAYPNDKEEPFDVVIFVHGSGPSNRDEQVGNQAIFRDLARSLASEGIASLRYDKRTYVYGDKIQETYGENITVQEETIDDVLAAINTIKTQTEFKIDKIYIAGHSMGGMLLGKIAEQTDVPSGYIFLAANARGLEELTLEQYEYLLNLDSEMSKEDKELLDTIKEGAQNIAALTQESNLSAEELLGISKTYWMWFKSYNPVDAAANITKPMLFLQGEKDYQVTMTDFNIYKDKLSQRTDVDFISYSDLNHMFTVSSGEKSTPQDYDAMLTVAPKVSRDIASFISFN